MRAEHGVDEGRPLDDALSVLLRQAPADGDLHPGASGSQRLQVAEVPVELVVGVLADAAGVENDEIRFLEVLGALHTVGAELGRKAFRVVLVHLAPERPDVELPRSHRPRIGPSQGHARRVPLPCVSVRFGANVGTGGELRNAILRAAAMGAEAVQFFAQNARAWKSRPWDETAVGAYQQAKDAHPGVSAVFCHAPYLINLAAKSSETAERSVTCLDANLLVSTSIGADGLVLHLGSHLGAGLEAVLADIVRTLRQALEKVEQATQLPAAPILLENTAGAGGTIGRSVEDLARVLAEAGGDHRLGVCIDTQHLFASGVDFTTPAKADQVVASLDRTVGLDRLRCIHLNDSKVPLGANSDRHANPGEGLIGKSGLGALISHPALQRLPAILETAGISGRGAGAEDLAVVRRIHSAALRRRRGPR